jgi:hypothetical protein
MLMASLRATSVSFSFTSIGFSKQTNHIGILKMLRPILNYTFECNLQQHGGHYNEKAASHWEQIFKKICRKLVQVLFLKYDFTLTA